MAFININTLTVNNYGNVTPPTNPWTILLFVLCIVAVIVTLVHFIVTGDSAQFIKLVTTLASANP